MSTSSRAADHLGIVELQSAYADCVTRRAWSELDGMFRPDATLLVSDGRETRTIEGPRAIGELIDRAVASLDVIFFTNLNTRIELYTEGYAASRDTSKADAVLQRYAESARAAQAAGLEVNAGHDLSRENLTEFLCGVPGVREVSIGHAFVSDALELGYAATTREYLSRIEEAARRMETDGH